MNESTRFIQTQVSQDEYQAFLNSTDPSGLSKSDSREIEQIEDALELRRGVLKGEEYYVGKSVCSCGKQLSFLDFVITAISSDNHSKPFLIHALLGNKYGFQTPRTVKCSSCGEVHLNSTYRTPNYSCIER